MRIVVAVLVLAAGLSGCGFTREAPLPVTYRLSAPALAAGEPLPFELSLPLPVPAPGLAGERIAVVYPDRRLDYFAGARWGADLPTVVQSLLVDALRNSGRLRAVQGEASPFTVTHVLQVEVLRFEASYAGKGPPTVQVALAATLGRRQGRAVIASYSASAAVPATADRLGAIAAAFEQAFGQAATELSARTLDALEAEQKALPR